MVVYIQPPILPKGGYLPGYERRGLVREAIKKKIKYR